MLAWLLNSLKVSQFVHRLLVNNLLGSSTVLFATGGGAYKYEKILREELKVDVKKVDEMNAVQFGLTSVLEKVKDSVFGFSTEYKHYSGEIKDLWPFLIVNIGSGVSMIKVSSPHSYERVSGTMIGGGILRCYPFRNSYGTC